MAYLASTFEPARFKPVHALRSGSKAVAWWIEFANGRHSSPYPSEADARAIIADAHASDAVLPESDPLWLVSSEGLRIAISKPSSGGRLRPIKAGVAVLLAAVVVGGAIYCGEHTTPPFRADASVSLPVRHTAHATVLPSQSTHTQRSRNGGRNSGLERLVIRILNAQDRGQKRCAGTTRRMSLGSRLS